MEPVADKIYSEQEYFELEKGSEIKYEYLNGTLIPMAGETINANRIANNCFRLFDQGLSAARFDILLKDVRLVTGPGLRYRYPDLVLAPRQLNGDANQIDNPILIVEVLSESTFMVDKRDKLKEYLLLPTLQYYVLVEQAEMFVEVYQRTGGWGYSSYVHAEDQVSLETLGLSLPLSDIYRNVSFG